VQAETLKQEHISLLADRAVANLPLTDEVVDKARTAAIASETVADAYRQALQAARARQATADADEQHAAHRARWDDALAIADKRQATLERLAAVAAEFASTYTEALKLNSDLVAALPEVPDHDAGQLRFQHIETLVRQELVRLDVSWAFSHPWGKHSLEPMVPQFQRATALIHSWQPKD
jgi:hypothetical protein